MSKRVLDMRVMEPGRAGTVVADGTRMYGVLFMVVMLPVRPEGAAVTGILVGPGM